MSAFERVGGNAIDTPAQAREREQRAAAPTLRPGTTMGRIADLEKGIEALRSDLGRLRRDYRELETRVSLVERDAGGAE